MVSGADHLSPVAEEGAWKGHVDRGPHACLLYLELGICSQENNL